MANQMFLNNFILSISSYFRPHGNCTNPQWDYIHVRLPFSADNQIMPEATRGNLSARRNKSTIKGYKKCDCFPKQPYIFLLHIFRWDLVTSTIQIGAKTAEELKKQIIRYNHDDDNMKFEGIVRLRTMSFNTIDEQLYTFVGLFAFWKTDEGKRFFQETLPKVRELCLAIPQQITKLLPLLKKDSAMK